MRPAEQRPTPEETRDLHFEAMPTGGAVPTAGAVTTAGDLRDRLAGSRFESAAHVVVLDDDRRLLGLARIEDVLAATSSVTLGELMDPDPPVIITGVDEEVAAWTAVRHGESALAVIDDDGRFVRLIPPRRIVEVLLAEHDEDLARLGGYLASTSSARRRTGHAGDAR